MKSDTDQERMLNKVIKLLNLNESEIEKRKLSQQLAVSSPDTAYT